MGRRYFKRFRMEIDLSTVEPPLPLPEGYRWVAWSRRVLPMHAQVKARCFENELDSILFPCLGDYEGCHRLMKEIAARKGFHPEATWLIKGPSGAVGTVQGVGDDNNFGMIQNLGIVPEARGLGLGERLLRKALLGFLEVGHDKGTLQVTADNGPALALYRRMGFRRVRTLYKSVDVPPAAHQEI